MIQRLPSGTDKRNKRLNSLDLGDLEAGLNREVGKYEIGLRKWRQNGDSVGNFDAIASHCGCDVDRRLSPRFTGFTTPSPLRFNTDLQIRVLADSRRLHSDSVHAFSAGDV